MKRDTLRLLVITDGKPGHQNQSLGLAEAIARLRPAEIHILRIPAGRLRSLARLDTPRPLPDLLIGAGHSTHAPLLQLARRTGVPCVVLMKPSFPSVFFDLCLVPEHDLGLRSTDDHVIPTKGALNRVPPPDGSPRQGGGLILLGGPSASHVWDGAAIRLAISTIVSTRGDLPWRITDSRRTPAGEIEALRQSCPALLARPHRDTGADWLPQRLRASSEVWVSEDSVSMIYEALSSGAAVGLLPVPAKRRRSRVGSGIDRLVGNGWATRFADWNPGTPLAPPPAVLREADRAARIVLDRLLPKRP
jgi:mitochondrial fission protein ELM1